MDLLSRIASWLSEHEATISAVVGITVLAGVLFAGVRWLLLRGTAGTPEKLLVRPGRRTILIAAAAAVFLLLVGVVAWLVWPDDPTREVVSDVGPEPSSAKKSRPLTDEDFTVPGFSGVPAIAVLPFDNLSGDPEQEYFADGIAEDLITRLSAWRQFPVIARNSSFTYKGKAVDVKQVSRELGVRYVVEGSVRRSENRIRIAAQVVDASTGHHVWAETYNRELRDIFALQDEITEAIVAAMYPELIRSEQKLAARKEPQNLDAWDCVVRGEWHAWKFTREDIAKARSFFERATELDPTFARPFALLALTYAMEATSGWSDSLARSIDEVNRLARRSLELDESEPRAYVALAHAFRLAEQPQETIAAYERVIELNPNNARFYGELGWYLSYTGRPDEAIAHLERAMRFSPKDQFFFMWLNGMGWAHFCKGRYDEAASWLERSRQRRPDVHVTHRALAATYAQLGRLEEAQMALREDLRLAPDESVSRIKAQIPDAAPTFLEPYLDGLRKAGLPE